MVDLVKEEDGSLAEALTRACVDHRPANLCDAGTDGR
jgi:hypothetical protein